MQSKALLQIIKHAAAPERAKHYFERLTASGEEATLHQTSPEDLRLLAALFSGSMFLGDLLGANPEWLKLLAVETLREPRHKHGLRAEVERRVKLLVAARNYEEAFARLRRFKQFEMLRIAARDLGRLSNAVEITREISDVADVCLETVWRICQEQFTERFGRPYHPDTAGYWHETPACVLGLGKLGGHELNYSSDVDLMFLYADEGQVFKKPPKGKTPISPRVMSNHQFFNRLAEAFIGEVTRLTSEGALFRVDLRLRPEGDTGPLCRSLDSYENYYAQWGQIWERMMLIKARGVAGDKALTAEFLDMIQSFRFPRSAVPGMLREIAAAKQRTENEIVRSGELDRNVKLGRGGIREIEFVVQAFQLLHAGRQPFLQNAQTLPTLAKLAEYKLVDAEDAQNLDAAYRFLRDVEHRLQMEANLQTHTIPTDPAARERLGKLMGFKTRTTFEAARRAHSANVRRVYESRFQTETPVEKTPFPGKFDGAEVEWKNILANHRFRDPDAALRRLKEFVEGPGFVHVSNRTGELARQLLPSIFALCPKPPRDKDQVKKSDLPTAAQSQAVLSDPDRVVTRLDSFISAYGTRAALFEMWTTQRPLFELLLLLFDRSEFLAETVIRAPELFEELVFGDRLRQRKTAQHILEDLRHGRDDADQFLWLRRYHEAELLRLGSRDILGLVDFEHNLGELSALADACLQYALEVVMRKNKIKMPPFVIVGLGKLGGAEITYGSDLDVIFVTDAKAKDLPKLQRLAAELMDLVSRRTEKGTVFQVDARLRPDGEKGLLVNTLGAFEEYYRQRAQLWEIQALTRSRSVAGNLELGEKFQTLVAGLTNFSDKLNPGAKKQKITRSKVAPVSCHHSKWKETIHQMRGRIEKERQPVGRDKLAIKTGRGGLMDAEFIAQAVCLRNGWHEAHTLRALARAQEAGALPDGEKLIASYKKLRRVEGILRRWSYEGETVLPDDPAPYYRVSVRCGFATPDEFRQALADWRREIRAAYTKFFEP